MSDGKTAWRMSIKSPYGAQGWTVFYGNHSEAVQKQQELLVRCEEVWPGWRKQQLKQQLVEKLEKVDDFPYAFGGWRQFLYNGPYYGPQGKIMLEGPGWGYVRCERQDKEYILYKVAEYPEPYEAGYELLRTDSDLVLSKFLYAWEDFGRGRGFSAPGY